MTTPDLEPTERIPISNVPNDETQAGLAPPPQRGRGLLRMVSRLVVLLLLGGIGMAAVALLITPTRESVLVLGSDARPDEITRGEVGRTDTLLIVVADRAAPRLAMLSVPRDLLVQIPGYGEERINAAYEFGGSSTAKQTVANVLGQRVDRYVLVGLQGVRDIVDAVGGVDINVTQAIHDDAYPTDDYGYQTVDIPVGRQHMDGATALEFARTRHQDSDFARTARQQEVLSAIRNTMLEPINWPRIPAVVAAVSRSVKTDASPLDAIAVAAAILRDRGNPDHMVIDTRYVSEVTGADGAYLLQPKPTLRPAVAEFLAGPNAVSVEVLNGAGVSGLATRTADRLSQAGYVIANVGDAAQPQPQTTISAKPSATTAAQRIAATLGVSSSRVTASSSLSTSDVRITLGADAAR